MDVILPASWTTGAAHLESRFPVHTHKFLRVPAGSDRRQLENQTLNSHEIEPTFQSRY